MLEKNPDTVKVVYKNFPLRSHRMALPAAMAALAAHEQGKFWEYHDKIFENNNYKKLTQEMLVDFARELKLDVDKFQKNMRSPQIQQQVARDFNDGRLAGVGGTPTLFVDGMKVKSRSPQGIQMLIDKALKK